MTLSQCMVIFISLLTTHAELATFKVDSVEKATNSLSKANLEDVIIHRLGGLKPESFSKLLGKYHPVDTHTRIKNAFVAAVHTAYAYHYPLVISPDMIWICIAQEFAQHVNQNAEKMSQMFVEHEGRKEIEVRRDFIVKGSPNNDWQGVFEEFSEKIKKEIGAKMHELLTPEFSTTGPVEKAASWIVLMDAFKEYFSYRLLTMCGIPEITLEGTVDDWKQLREKTLGLAQFDLDWWIDALKPILDEFVNAASGTVNQKFWSATYKQEDESGGPYITGWILTLFPYTGSGKNMSKNQFLNSWNESEINFFHGLTTDGFTPGTVSTPFNWIIYYDSEIKTYPMYFYAGFMAVGQDPATLAIRPEIGWAVVKKKRSK